MYRLGSIATAFALAVTSVFAQGAQPTTKPNDAQIAHIAYTAGVLDVEAGKQALAISKNKDVREFAQQMVKDHTAVNDQALALVKKLKVTPEDNATSKGLTEQASARRAELAKLSGAAFDKAYMSHMVDDHKQDVAEFKKEANGGKDGDVKGFAAKTLPTLEEHLKLAQTTNDAVKKGAKTASK